MANQSKRLRYCQLTINPCSRTYGVAPCTAAVGVTGDFKCYNSPRTCQDVANYQAGADQVIRWAEPTGDLPKEIEAIPSISSISRREQVIDPGESLGTRESVTVSFHNHLHNDAGFDNYIADRGYNTYLKGTFWGKFSARWGNITGYKFQTIDGYLGQDIAEMKTRDYIVESTNGPDNSGNFSITAKDAIKFADNEKAQAPTPSPGVLLNSITDSQTSITLTPAGVGAQYPTTGSGSIGDEAISWSNVVGDVMTISRGAEGTDAVAHDAGETVQIALIYSTQDPADIFYDLMANYTEVPNSYLDLADYQAESTQHINLVYTAKIYRPTPIKKLVNELIKEVGLIVYTDIESRKIRFKALRPFVPVVAINDDNAIAGSMSVKRLLEKRLSDVWVYHGKKNPLEEQTDLKNYAAIYAGVTDNSIVALENNTSAIRTITSRFIPTSNQAAAAFVASSMLARYETPPRQAVFSTTDNYPILTGEAITVQSRLMENSQGDIDEPVNMQVISCMQQNGRFLVKAEEIVYGQIEAGNNRFININQNVYNINLRNLHDSIYASPQAGDTVTLVIGAGAIIGSLSNGNFALDVGSWPAGVTLKIDGTGRIQGRGGDGQTASPGYQNGGDALTLSVAVEIIGAIEIWGGGGSGGAFGSPLTAGGGGAGSLPGSPGATTEAGGASLLPGGGPGLPGASGGAAGRAVVGYSNLTLTATPDIRGATVG